MSRNNKPLSPQRLAKLANALGVSTPLTPSIRKDSHISSSSSRFFLHVIPPTLLDPDIDLRPRPSTSGYHKHFLRGTLVPLHSTLQAQLAAIAREYALPSTTGLILYLINSLPEQEDEPGPRLSDEIWKHLWSRVSLAERSPSPLPSPFLRPLTCSPSADSPFPPSTPSSSIRSNSVSDPGTPDTSIHSARSPQNSLDLPGLSSPSLIPILAKVEFDIDRRKATWYLPWVHNRLNKNHLHTHNQGRNTPVLDLLTVKRLESLKSDPLPLSPDSPSPNDLDVLQSPSPIIEQPIPEEPDTDDTVTYQVQNLSKIDDYDTTNITSDHLSDVTNNPFENNDSGHIKHHTINDSVSTQEEELLEMLDIMSKSRSRSTSSIRSDSTRSSLSGERKTTLPPLVIDTNMNTDVDSNPNLNEDDSFLAYTEPEIHDSPPVVPTQSHGVKREFAVFDDLDLELDPTLDIDENDPNDRRKSQIIMRAKLDEIERTMAQLSPRILQPDLSLSEGGSSLGVSPISPKSVGHDFLAPGNISREFITSSPPRLGLGRREGSDDDGQGETEDLNGKSWPAIPFSIIKENEKSSVEKPNGPPPLPRLALNGVSTLPPRAFTAPPTRPPPPPPLNGLGVSAAPMSESEKRRREVEEEQGMYDVTVKEGLLHVGGENVIPLSPDPFGRYPSSSSSPPALADINGDRVGALEKRARSRTNGELEVRARSGTSTMASRFSDDMDQSATGGAAPAGATTTKLMSVKTIKKLWRKSKDKEKEKNGASASGSEAAPPPTPPLAAGFSAASTDIDKSLPLIPPPPLRPERPSEEQLDLPDISMQAAVPPSLSPKTNVAPKGVMPLNHNGMRRDTINGSGRKTPQELTQTGNQSVLPPASRPSLDLLIPTQEMHGQRSPQEHMAPPPSRPSLDQLGPPLGSGRRTPQDQFTFPPRPSPDQPSPLLPPPNHLPSHLPPQMYSHPNPLQMPMFQGRNPHNGPVKPVLAMHYPSRSVSASSSSSQKQQQPDKLDVNKLMFDQESPYPVRFGGGNVASTAGQSSSVGASTAASTLPPPPPPLPEPAGGAAGPGAATMRKSILKSKLAHVNANGNGHGFSESSSSSSSSSASPVIGAAVLRQSSERAGASGHGHIRGGAARGGRRPSVLHFGSTSVSSASSTSSVGTMMHRIGGSSSGGEVIPPNPQVPTYYLSSGDAKAPGPGLFRAAAPGVGGSNTSLSPTLEIPSSAMANAMTRAKEVGGGGGGGGDLSRPPSRQSVEEQQARSHSPISRRSDASSFDMTQFEFVSPVLGLQPGR